MLQFRFSFNGQCRHLQNCPFSLENTSLLVAEHLTSKLYIPHLYLCSGSSWKAMQADHLAPGDATLVEICALEISINPRPRMSAWGHIFAHLISVLYLLPLLPYKFYWRSLLQCIIYAHILVLGSASRKYYLKSLLPGVVLRSTYGGWNSVVEPAAGQQARETLSLVVSRVLLIDLESVTTATLTCNEKEWIQV